MHEQQKDTQDPERVRRNAVSASRFARVRYAVITPVRDEEQFIAAMIESIAAQTIPPARWIIVDDGSRDQTPQIVTEYSTHLPFLELVRLSPRQQRLAGGEGAIPAAMKRLNLSEFDYLARFDADLVFPPDYIARILREFDREPRLGIAGGVLYIEREGRLILEKEPEEHVRGALKMYRRACLAEIGTLSSHIGWDTLDEAFAWSRGWQTRSFTQAAVLHRRPTGEGIPAPQVYRQRGRAEYLTWSDPLFVLGKSVKIAVITRSLLKPGCYLLGFIQSYMHKETRSHDRALVRARRNDQRSRMKRILRLCLPGARRATAALPTH
jgi:poly-beta-1,6-N-acetyl-D-glucosamine synthase